MLLLAALLFSLLVSGYINILLSYIQCRGQERVELHLHSPNTPSWRGAQLKHRDNFTFTYRLR
jgi:hypothetical protein